MEPTQAVLLRSTMDSLKTVCSFPFGGPLANRKSKTNVRKMPNGAPKILPLRESERESTIITIGGLGGGERERPYWPSNQSPLSLPASQPTSQPSESRTQSFKFSRFGFSSVSVFSLMSGTQLAARLVRNSQNWPNNI